MVGGGASWEHATIPGNVSVRTNIMPSAIFNIWISSSCCYRTNILHQPARVNTKAVYTHNRADGRRNLPWLGVVN